MGGVQSARLVPKAGTLTCVSLPERCWSSRGAVGETFALDVSELRRSFLLAPPPLACTVCWFQVTGVSEVSGSSGVDSLSIVSKLVRHGSASSFLRPRPLRRGVQRLQRPCCADEYFLVPLCRASAKNSDACEQKLAALSLREPGPSPSLCGVCGFAALAALHTRPKGWGLGLASVSKGFCYVLHCTLWAKAC